MTTLKETITQIIVAELNRQYEVDCTKAYIPAGDADIDTETSKPYWCLDGYYNLESCAEEIIKVLNLKDAEE